MQIKSENESLPGRLATGVVLGMLAAVSSADSGHSVPIGVSTHQHVHLYDQILASPAVLAVVGMASIALTLLVVKRRQIRSKVQ